MSSVEGSQDAPSDVLASPSNAERIRAYKNNALDPNELRRRREEEGIQLRKQKREDLLRKRRNLNEFSSENQPAGSYNANSGAAGDTAPISNHDPSIQDPSVSSNTHESPLIGPEVIAGLHSSDPEQHLIHTRSVRHILSKSTTAPINEVIDSGIVPRLVEFLDCHDTRELQFEATWCLTNVCSGDHIQTCAVVNAGAVPKLIRLLASPSHLVREQAVWAMGNIAGEGPTERDILLREGCVTPLIEAAKEVKSLSPQMLRNISWCIVNLVRYKNPPAPFDTLVRFLPCLACFLHQNDPDVLVDTCWAIAHLGNGSNEQIQAILNANVSERLVQLLLHPKLDVCVGALRAVGNLVTGDDQQTQVLLNCGVLPALRILLESGSQCCHKEVCWSLSNITAGNSSQVQQTMEAGLFSLLVRFMSHGDFKLRKEAAWSIVNACLGGLPEHVHALVADGCIQPLCQLLSVDDMSVVGMAISGIECILRVGEREAKRTGGDNLYALKVEECGGLDRIEFLQMHQSTDIYRRAYDVIDRYFGLCCEEADSTVAPVSASDHYEFAPSTSSDPAFHF